MKRLVMLLLVMLFTSPAAYAQVQQPQLSRDSLPYMKYPAMPAFNIRLLDSFTVFNTFNIPKGKPTLLALFDPDCKHCQMVIKELVAGIDSISNIDIYWFTLSAKVGPLQEFYKEYHFADYKNIKVIGRDYEFFFLDYFGVNSYPDFALYDENKKFVHLFQGRVTVKELYELTHKEVKH